MTRLDIIQEYATGKMSFGRALKMLIYLTPTEALFLEICLSEEKMRRRAQKIRIRQAIRQF